jgi:ribonuclease P protein component
VSRRIGKAVVRNRVRRRVREAVRLQVPNLAGFDLLVIARPAVATASWSELRGAVDDLLRRARVLGRRAPQPEAG